MAVFCKSRGDLCAAAQCPAVPGGPAAGVLPVGLPQLLLSPMGDGRVQQPWGAVALARSEGAPFTQQRSHAGYPAPRASSRWGRVSLDISTVPPGSGDEMG